MLVVGLYLVLLLHLLNFILAGYVDILDLSLKLPLPLIQIQQVVLYKLLHIQIIVLGACRLRIVKVSDILLETVFRLLDCPVLLVRKRN